MNRWPVILFLLCGAQMAPWSLPSLTVHRCCRHSLVHVQMRAQSVSRSRWSCGAWALAFVLFVTSVRLEKALYTRFAHESPHRADGIQLGHFMQKSRAHVVQMSSL